MEAAQACLSLHLSKYHIVGIHMSWLICINDYACMDPENSVRRGPDNLLFFSHQCISRGPYVTSLVSEATAPKGQGWSVSTSKGPTSETSSISLHSFST